ncbi:hypothetical protein Poly59_36130 [Rubripirellula reticaptiva]|uniref:Uncharacterized protein n=1 Tax=Rubripirellula reticaptiva TaxID=2528013 RepID=A0A5C6EWE9_9BACT|nr:hypothetical protein Poly59_36130 [Rubripirellula reticaptiva]
MIGEFLSRFFRPIYRPFRQIENAEHQNDSEYRFLNLQIFYCVSKLKRGDLQ